MANRTIFISLISCCMYRIIVALHRNIVIGFSMLFGYNNSSLYSILVLEHRDVFILFHVMHHQSEQVVSFLREAHVKCLGVVGVSDLLVYPQRQSVCVERFPRPGVLQYRRDSHTAQQHCHAQPPVVSPYDAAHAQRSDVEREHGWPSFQGAIEVLFGYGSGHEQPAFVSRIVRHAELVWRRHEIMFQEKLVRQGAQVCVQQGVVPVQGDRVPRVCGGCTQGRGAWGVLHSLHVTLYQLALQTGTPGLYNHSYETDRRLFKTTEKNYFPNWMNGWLAQ